MVNDRVRRYFDGEAERFDAIYREEKRFSQKLVDWCFRSVIHRRFQLTFELCGEVTGRRVLDIGCGSGRYALEFARRGARVVGLDFAQSMLALARRGAARAGVGGCCRFVEADFLSWREPLHFDFCLAIGLFDYIENPGPFLEKIRALTRRRAVFSFPVRWTLRSPTRWLRLRLKRCPVYFYSRGQVLQWLAAAGWEKVEVHCLGRDYLVCGRV